MTVITSYASGKDLTARYDSRLLGDIVGDEGVKIPVNEVAQHPNMLAALSDAYGVIISTIVVGNRYTLAQLDPGSLAATGLSYLIRLNCDLAFIYLKRRRGRFDDTKDAALLKETNASLKQLQDGAGFLLQATADHATASVIGLANPTLIPVPLRNTIRFGEVNNYYPARYPYNGRQRQIGNSGQ